MKTVVAVGIAVLLAGCASQSTIGKQTEELKALSAYHVAQKEQEKAKQAVDTASKALDTSVMKRAEADKAVKDAKAELDKQLKQTSKE